MLTLRSRLLASYLLLMAITLGVITLALSVLLRTLPAPPQPTYDRLSSLMRGSNLGDDFVPVPSETRPRFGRNAEAEAAAAELNIYAETRGVRAMLILTNRQQQTFVFHDTGAVFNRGDPILLVNDPQYRNPEMERVLRSVQRVDLLYGSFSQPDGEEWLYSALAFIGDPGPASLDIYLMLAEPRPVQPLLNTLVDFGLTVFRPVAQAALIGVLAAMLLAWLISRTIARPLQAMSHAATAVANGDHNQQVPVSGPLEVRAVAEAFNHMNAEVRSTQQAQRDFMANVSHDLKTPLTSIQGYSQAIMDGAAADPVHAAAIIHDEAARLNRMVADLTDLARLQAGQLHLQRAPLDLGQITRTVAQKLDVVAQKKNIVLNVDVARLPLIAGDGDRIVQVLNNLIGNAIKYTPNGGKVVVSGQRNGGGVEVTITDNGPGIPEKDLGRIFERFYQVDKARGPRRGTGLGLAITREIVEAHDGQISVQSEAGKGTRFTVWFPISDEGSTVTRIRV